MNKNIHFIVSSVVRPTSFIKKWTGIDAPSVWLEADKKEDNLWTIYAFGTSEYSRRCRTQNLNKIFLENTDITIPSDILSIPSLESKAQDGTPIDSYQNIVLAGGKTLPESLAYFVFFEEQCRNGYPSFYNKDCINFEQLSQLHRMKILYQTKSPFMQP